MSIYLILYIVFIILLLFIGIQVYLKYKNQENGKYFLLSMILYSIWLFFYLMSYTTTYDKDTLIYISRLLYSITIPASYSFLFFYLLKGRRKISSRVKIRDVSIFLSFIGIILFSLTTNYVISDMVYNPSTGLYYEEYGSLYGLYMIIYFLFIPLFFTLGALKIKKLKTIDKMRYKFIYLGFSFYILSIIVLLVIFPILGIRGFEKEIVIFFSPFIGAVLYSIHKYHFGDIYLGVGKIFVITLCLFWSLVIINLIKYYFLHLDNIFGDFWSITSTFGVIDLLLALIIFILLNIWTSKVILGNNKYNKFHIELNNMKKNIPFITTVDELNGFLKRKFQENFKIKGGEKLLVLNQGNNVLLKDFFSKYEGNNLFINDIVFIEENKHKFDYQKIKSKISKQSYLIFPLYSNDEYIGMFQVGKKPFGDQYTSEEIDILKDFVGFIEGHLKYIDIYKTIHDLSVNLDKKVDEKTIEYNNLLSRQKEFINTLSHEIKSPISGAIFQADSLIDDIGSGESNLEEAKQELELLNTQLIKSGELINKLFSMQYYDSNNVTLFIEKIDIGALLRTEVDVYQKMNENIVFTLNIEDNLGFVNLDRVQFTQVITNIVGNSIKFLDKELGSIIMDISKKGENLYIAIEDNGQGFDGIDVSKIFDKYNSGESNSIGLGMGLYLCKRIVDLHKGTITASKGKEGKGARFSIQIPVK